MNVDTWNPVDKYTDCCVASGYLSFLLPAGNKRWYKLKILINLNFRLRFHGQRLPNNIGTLLPGIESGPAIMVGTNAAIYLEAATILREHHRDSLRRNGSITLTSVHQWLE